MKLAPIPVQKSECAIGTCDNWTIGPRFAVLGRSIWALSGRVALGGRFPGLKPGAESCSPFGPKNEGLSPKIVADSPLGANHPENYLRAIWDWWRPLRQRVRPRGIFFSKSTPAEDTRPRAIGLRGGQVHHRLAKYQRRRNGPPGCQNALLCCQVGKPAWYGAASLREAWQNSWLTPPRLRSLIGLHERSAPRGVFGDACRGRNG
jgi:hypothetical protein